MRHAKFAAAVLIAALFALPVFAQRGHADFTRFFAIGDSYGAGVESGSLNERHQPWSWPAVIARQVGLQLCPPTATATDPCWSQPLVGYPGIGPELVLASLAPSIVPAGSSNGSPLMLTYARPYNNLAIPGATVGALLAITGREPQQPNEPTPVAFGRFILRGNGTALDQAISQNPTFIAMWIGGNDILGSVLAGTDQGMTTGADFKTRYEAVLDSLISRAPNAGMVVGTLPTNPARVALLATIPPFIVDPATRLPVPGPGGQPIYFIADLGNGNIGQLPPGSAVLLTAQTRLASGFGFPNVPPFNALPNAGKPLPASDVLTTTELTNIVARANEYNGIITTAAAARSIPVADIKGLFERVSDGLQLGPIRVTGAYISGGFFSLDGFHLTDLGYALFADEYIKAINAAYDTEIPLAGISQLYSNNGAFFPETTTGQMIVDAAGFIFTDAAAAQISNMWAQRTVAATPAKSRGVRR